MGYRGRQIKSEIKGKEEKEIRVRQALGAGARSAGSHGLTLAGRMVLGVGTSVAPCAPGVTTSRGCPCPEGGQAGCLDPSSRCRPALFCPKTSPRAAGRHLGCGWGGRARGARGELAGSSPGCPGAPGHPDPVRLPCRVHRTLITPCLRGDGSTATAELRGGSPAFGLPHNHEPHAEHRRAW